MAEHQLTCVQCDAQFTSTQTKAKYCGTACRDEASRQRKRRERKPPQRIAALSYKCSWCGGHYHPKRADRSRYCSRACFFDRKRAERLVGRVYVRTRIKPKNKAPHDYPREPERCFACGEGYYKTKKYQRYCCQECGEAHRKASIKAGRRASKARRRARTRGCPAGQYIDPIKVFERDAWRCGICGCKTFRAKRGTYHAKAPELDHIVALANGGTHTWDNVQCSCRACNGAKGAGDYGQIPMFPMGYGGIAKL